METLEVTLRTQRTLNPELDGDGLLLLQAWKSFLAVHWHHHETLRICWDLAQVDPAAALKEIELAVGIGRTGNLHVDHYLIGCVQYFAPMIQQCARDGYRFPSGMMLEEQLRAYRDRPTFKRSKTEHEWGPGGSRERWT